MAWCENSICVGFKRDYYLIRVHAAEKDNTFTLDLQATSVLIVNLGFFQTLSILLNRFLISFSVSNFAAYGVRSVTQIDGRGSIKELFPTGKQLEPLVAPLADGNVIVVQEDQTVVLNEEGACTQKCPLTWTDIPIAMGEKETQYLWLFACRTQFSFCFCANQGKYRFILVNGSWQQRDMLSNKTPPPLLHTHMRNKKKDQL